MLICFPPPPPGNREHLYLSSSLSEVRFPGFQVPAVNCGLETDNPPDVGSGLYSQTLRHSAYVVHLISSHHRVLLSSHIISEEEM